MPKVLRRGIVSLQGLRILRCLNLRSVTTKMRLMRTIISDAFFMTVLITQRQWSIFENCVKLNSAHWKAWRNMAFGYAEKLLKPSQCF